MSYTEIAKYVKNTPIIWQKSHPQYKKFEITKRVWEKMAKDLNSDEIVLRKRWNNLTVYYRALHKKVMDSENPEEMTFAWKYYKYMTFLGDQINHKDKMGRPYPKKRKTVNTPSVSNQITQIKVDEIKMANDSKWQGDPDYMFLMSILPSMRSLTDIQKLQFRRKVSQWLLEIYAQNTGNHSGCSNMYIQTTYSANEDTKEHIVIQQID